jgi:NapC/NirT cytochrome c family, N-terminal region
VPSRAALARHPLSISGAVITTASAVGFIALTIALLAGLLTNPYAGLVTFVALPLVFILGLLLIPAGMWLQARALRRDPTAVADWPVVDLRKPRTRRVAWLIAVLTAINAVIVLVAGYGTLHWMESPGFCGQVCHTPMHPQFTAWQAASHATVACVACHIGEGAGAFVHYKLAGVRQLAHVITNHYPRPIRGIADMRPGLETCGACHVPTRDMGDRLRLFREYADDEANSVTTSALQVHVGGPGQPTPSGRAIHWHADPRVRIEYVTTDNMRETIPYVKVTDARGQVREYTVEGASATQLASAQRRQMDCIDCHNVVGHRISPSAEKAVDAAIAAGEISHSLPFVRREGVKLLSGEYPTQDAGLQTIDRELRGFYQAEGQRADQRLVQQAVAALQTVYARNVFPVMKVTWGVYPDHLGHIASAGCFRCHDGGHTAKDGGVISADCEYCHRDVANP